MSTDLVKIASDKAVNPYMVAAIYAIENTDSALYDVELLLHGEKEPLTLLDYTTEEIAAAYVKHAANAISAWGSMKLCMVEDMCYIQHNALVYVCIEEDPGLITLTFSGGAQICVEPGQDEGLDEAFKRIIGGRPCAMKTVG